VAAIVQCGKSFLERKNNPKKYLEHCSEQFFNEHIVHLLNSRTVKVFVSCRTVVQRLVIFTLTLVQKLEISSLKLSEINSVSCIQNITYTKWLHKKKIWNVKEYC
jgi:hypothetical protein